MRFRAFSSLQITLVVIMMAWVMTVTCRNDTVYDKIIQMVRNIDNKITNLDKKVDNMDHKIAKIDGTVDNVNLKVDNGTKRLEEKIEKVNEKVDNMTRKLEANVDKVDGKVSKVNEKLDKVDEKITDVNKNMKKMRMNEQVLDVKMIDVEQDMRKLETRHIDDINKVTSTMAKDTRQVISELNKLSWLMFPVTFLGYGIHGKHDDHVGRMGTLGECINFCTTKRKYSGVAWNGFQWHLNSGTCYCHRNEGGHSTSNREWLHFRFL